VLLGEPDGTIDLGRPARRPRLHLAVPLAFLLILAGAAFRF
jgi:hypothetical protein